LVTVGLVNVLLVNVSVPANVVNVPVVGNVTFVVAVAVNVVLNAPEVAKVEPSATVNVELVAGAVIVTLFTDVAVATPNVGVVKVGDVANTSKPEPVSSVTADAKLADDGVAKNVATPVPKPETPVDIGSPVQLVNVPELGVPNTGVVSVGDVSVLLVSVSVVVLPTNVSVATGNVSTEVPAVAPDNTVVVPDVEPLNLTPVVPNVGSVAKTNEPLPVSSVTALAKLADDGVPKKVATPVPKESVENDLLAGYVQNTSFVPALNVTAAPALDDSNTVVLANVPAPTVPIPVSHSAPLVIV